MHPSIALTLDQAGIFENAQVFGDGRKRNGERFSQIGDATFGPSQKIEDPASGRIRQGSEDGVERWAVRMLNHMVKYCSSLCQCKQNLMVWTCEPDRARARPYRAEAPLTPRKRGTRNRARRFGPAAAGRDSCGLVAH